MKNFSPERIFLRLSKHDTKNWFGKANGEAFQTSEKSQIIQQYTSFVGKRFQNFSGDFRQVFLGYTKTKVKKEEKFL